MQRIATIVACALLGAVAFGTAPAGAVDVRTSVQAKATDISAQSRKRPRTTLTIRPRGYP